MAKMKNQSMLIILIAWLAYLVSYIGRSDYSACLLEILNDTGAARATAGMVTSSFAICNAVGQLTSTYIIKKISPFWVITTEIFSVAVINLLFPMSNSFFVMAILWGINGAMQSTLLCGITRIFAHTLQGPYLSRGAVLLNTIGAVGGLFNYLLSWALIRYVDWQAVFYLVAALLVAIGIVWLIVVPKLIPKKTERPVSTEKLPQPASISLGAVLKSYGTVYVILAAFFIGSLRESVALWIPPYINERFGLSSSLSVIVTAFVPCLQICGALLAGKIGRSCRNLAVPAGICFGASTLCLLLILVSAHVVLTVCLFVLNAIAMTAALTFLLSLFPIRHVGSAHVATVVGITNFFVHAGDFAASFGIGWISLWGGWGAAFTALCGSAVLGGILCTIGGYKFRKEIKHHGCDRVHR